MELNMIMTTKWSILAAAMLLPIGASAQSNDARYCADLIAKYQTYLGNYGTSKHEGMDQDATAKVAIDKCQAGDTATGIPILEGKLRDAKVGLPSRS
jgi:hypothetical protein